MSAGEGLDEAAKDAADIAAFFKSGKSGGGKKKKKGASLPLTEPKQKLSVCFPSSPGGYYLQMSQNAYA